MNNKFVLNIGYALIGLSFVLTFCGLIWMGIIGSWMFFPLAFGSMISGLSIVHLMKPNKKQKVGTDSH